MNFLHEKRKYFSKAKQSRLDCIFWVILPAPSPCKGGGLGMGLTTRSCKKEPGTNTRDQAKCGNKNDASQETGRMMDASQTQMEADRPMVEFMKPKKMRVACWNVRALYQTDKLAQVVREFDNYNLDILGISEARWTRTENRQLAPGHTIHYSGRTISTQNE